MEVKRGVELFMDVDKHVKLFFGISAESFFNLLGGGVDYI